MLGLTFGEKLWTAYILPKNKLSKQQQVDMNVYKIYSRPSAAQRFGSIH